MYCRRQGRLQAVDSSKYGLRWQEAIAQKLEHRKEFLHDKWTKTKLAHSLKEGQNQLLVGWRSTEIGQSIDKDIEALHAKWRAAELEEPSEFQKLVRAGWKKVNIIGESYYQMVTYLLLSQLNNQCLLWQVWACTAFWILVKSSCSLIQTQSSLLQPLHMNYLHLFP